MFVHMLSSQCLIKESSDIESSFTKMHSRYCSEAKQVFRHQEMYFCNNKTKTRYIRFMEQVSLPDGPKWFFTSKGRHRLI